MNEDEDSANKIAYNYDEFGHEINKHKDLQEDKDLYEDLPTEK